MNVEQIINSDEFKKCADFHGHLCPGLCIGYKAARAGVKSKLATVNGDKVCRGCLEQAMV
jgi:formylmethanofuran dehydrogenase subunit E